MYLLGVIKVIKVYVAIFDRFLGANKIRDFVIFVWLLREAWQSGPFIIRYLCQHFAHTVYKGNYLCKCA